MAETIGSAQYELGADRTKLKQDLDDAAADVQSAGQKTEQQAQQSLGKLQGLSGPARAAMLGVGVAVGSIGAMALRMGQDYAAGSNILIRETGASGDALKALQTSMGNVARQVPEDMQTVALAVSNVSKKFQLQGPDLDAATKKLLDYARVNKIDVTEAINGVDDVMDRLKLPTTELPGLLDKLTVAEQATGIKAGDLASSLAAVGPTLQNMGYSLDGSIALIAQWQSIGGSTEELTKGMNKAFIAFAKEGATDAQSAMQILIDKIKNAPTDMEATQIAADIFGAKIGVTMAQNIRNGGFDIAAFTQQVHDSGGQLDSVSDRSKTWGDRFHEFFNGIAAQVGPITGQLGEIGMGFSGLSKILTPLGGLLGGLVGHFISGFKGLAAKVIPAAVVEGTLIGEAQGEAQAVAATGPRFVSSLSSKFAGLSGTLQSIGSRAGGLVGTAMGAAVVVGLAAAAPMIDAEAHKVGVQANQAIFGGFNQAKGAAYGTVFDSIFDALHVAWDRIGEYDPLASAATKSLSKLLIFATEHSLDGNAARAAFEAALAQGLSVDAAYEAGLRAAGATGDGYAAGLAANTPTLVSAGISQWTGFALGVRPAAVAAGTDVGGGFVASAATASSDGWQQLGAAWIVQARSAGYGAADAARDGLAKGLREDQSSIRSAWQDFVHPGEDFMSATAEIAWVKGKLASRKLQEGLASDDPLRRQWAEQTKADMESRLDDLTRLLGQVGTDASNSLANNLNASPAVAAATEIARRVNAALDRIDTHRQIYINRVNGPDVTAGSRAHGGPVDKGKPYFVNEDTPNSEIFIPTESGYILPRDQMGKRFDMPPSGRQGRGDGNGGAPPTVVHLHIGTLIADEAGLAELGRRIEYAGGFGERTRTPLAGAY
ncbi:MAG: hypothetical protein QOJ81_534 [Chloroflexota bacterium]|jgi:TP901 family phage tail tape measure protein|nr:hypothetical protein [Chloroflexota bacterium]